MINLVKKDLRACFKTDLKTLGKLALGILLFSFLLMPMAGIATPLFVSYVFIFRSFYLDELNKTDYFFNSLPIEKDDIVYGKYVFSMIVIIVSLVFTFLYTKVLKGFWYIDLMTLQIALVSISLVLILMSICIPLVFKYGYNKSYIITNFIIVGVTLFTLFSAIKPQPEIWEEGMANSIIEPKYLILSVISILAYILSMYVSTKIYMKKEIAN